MEAAEIELLKKSLKYYPESGEFEWLTGQRKGTKYKGCLNKHLNYYVIRVAYKLYYAHRLAFVLMGEEAPSVVDHIDKNRSNNKWGNLRAATKELNGKNLKRTWRGETGVYGVDWCKALGRWRARIRENKKEVHLGYFENFWDAVCARKSAELVTGYHENHGQ